MHFATHKWLTITVTIDRGATFTRPGDCRVKSCLGEGALLLKLYMFIFSCVFLNLFRSCVIIRMHRIMEFFSCSVYIIGLYYIYIYMIIYMYLNVTWFYLCNYSACLQMLLCTNVDVPLFIPCLLPDSGTFCRYIQCIFDDQCPLHAQ